MGYTPENNPYIPGDPYSYDMAWMVEEVKKAQAVGESSIESMNAAEAWATGAIDGVPVTSDEPQYHNSAKYWADDSFVSAEQSEAWAVGTIQGIPVTSDKPQYENNSKYYADEAAASASDAADDAQTIADQLTELPAIKNRLTTAENDIDVLEGRVDSFASLPPGSTAGNAELLDIRVGADGITYASAGDAVRGQVDDLKNSIDTSSEMALDVEIGTNRYESGGSLVVQSNASRASTVPTAVPTAGVIYCRLADGYTASVLGRTAGTWADSAAYSGSFVHTFTGEEIFSIRILSGSSIPAGTHLIDVFQDIPSETDRKIADNFSFGDIEIGVNRYISGGKIVKSSLGSRASVAPFAPKYPLICIRPTDDIKYNIFGSINGTYTQINAAYEFDTQIYDVSAYDSICLQFASGTVISASAKLAEIYYMETMKPEGEIYTAGKYVGSRIITGQKIKFYNFMNYTKPVTQSIQGAAVYDKYLFIAYNELAALTVIDMETASVVDTITFTADPDIHANNINFGTQKYDAGDAFPLLYISAEDISVHRCLVYRITETGGVFSATLVQVITFPDPATYHLYYPNAILDNENDKMYIMGCTTNNYVVDGITKNKILVYDIPLLSDGDVSLNYADATSDFDIKLLTAPQGAYAIGGHIVQVTGTPYGLGDHEEYIRQISVGEQLITTLIHLNDYGITEEPEAIFLYKGSAYILFQTAYIYRIDFE